MSTRYEVNIENRDGKINAEIIRVVTTVPTSGRGKEWQKSSETVEVMNVPADDLQALSEAITSGLLFAAIDGIPVEESQRYYIESMDPLIKVLDSEPVRFWSYNEARAYVHAQRKVGKDTSSWVLRRGLDVVVVADSF